MKNLSIMIKPASSLCNLRCKYCFYKDISDMREVQSYGIMQEQTVKSMLDHIYADLKRGDKITFAFQGGEPTIAGLDYYRNFVQQVRERDKGIQVTYALQTNGTLIDKEWCQFLKEQLFLVGVSFDLLKEEHDEARVDARHAGTYESVLQTIHLLEFYKVDYNVLCTLTSEVAKEPQKIWKNILELDLQYVQFTPCLDDLENPEGNAYALTPELFSSFYKRMFSMWLKHFRKGKYRSIKMFDDLINLVAFHTPTACGMNGLCQPQLIIEADGSVYPCDFYCLDEYKLGSICEQSLEELYKKSMESPTKKRDPLPPICKTCDFKKICNGGCKRMQNNVCFSKDKEYCGNEEFLKYAIQDIVEIAKEEIAYRNQGLR